MTPPVPPDSVDIPSSEVAVARAVARRLGRAVYAVVDEPGGRRRLVDERPEDPATLAYLIDRGGAVRLGPAGRRSAPADGASLVHDPAGIPRTELAAVREHALVLGRTVFVADPDDETGDVIHFAAPVDGSLRYAVRPSGEVLTGAAAAAEPPASVVDPGWTARVGAALRQLRRLRDRADELAPLPQVTPREWSRLERLIPDAERRALHPGALVGLPGRLVADALRGAAEREVERLRRSWRPRQ